MEGHDAPVWLKSTFSSSGNCVEVAIMKGRVLVRNSRNRQGAILEFNPAEWTAFLSGVRAGEFSEATSPHV